MRGGTGKHRGPSMTSKARAGVWDMLTPEARESRESHEPLSPDALSVLVRADKAPVECRKVNPGIVRKLTSEGWATLVDIPNPLWRGLKPQLKARTVQALAITEKGKARIAFDEP